MCAIYTIECRKEKWRFVSIHFSRLSPFTYTLMERFLHMSILPWPWFYAFYVFWVKTNQFCNKNQGWINSYCWHSYVLYIFLAKTKQRYNKKINRMCVHLHCPLLLDLSFLLLLLLFNFGSSKTTAHQKSFLFLFSCADLLWNGYHARVLHK